VARAVVRLTYAARPGRAGNHRAYDRHARRPHPAAVETSPLLTAPATWSPARWSAGVPASPQRALGRPPTPTKPTPASTP